MSFCPNLSDPVVSKQFNELVAATNNELAHLIWDLNKGNFLDKNPDGSNNPAFSILANKVGKYNALKEVGLALIDSNKVTKPGVSELFESNPELANAVYEALGIGKRKTYKGNITELRPDQVFVFGSNLQGLHGRGAAGAAFGKQQSVSEISAIPDGTKGKWAIKGIGEGMMEGGEGKSYAFPTVITPGAQKSRTDDEIIESVKKLYDTAIANPTLEFLIAYSNVPGLAGYTPQELAKFFSSHNIPQNIIFEEGFNKLIEITPQQKQQALQQYSQYLNTIFPNSQVKDIVYHGSKDKFDKFDKSKLGQFTGAESAKKGFFFAGNYNTSLQYVIKLSIDIAKEQRKLLFQRDISVEDGLYLKDLQDQYNAVSNKETDELVNFLTSDKFPPDFTYNVDSLEELKNAVKESAEDIGADVNKYLSEFDTIIKEIQSYVRGMVINITNPISYDFKQNENYQTRDISFATLLKNKTNQDGAIFKNVYDPLLDNIYVAFEPEQIHILGSKKDIEGFKEFVASKSKPVEVLPTMTPAVLDASVKTAHLKLVSTVIGQKGLLGARDLITTFPSLDAYKELLGPLTKFYTQDELRQIYNGNKKYINSFISEFEKPIEENVTGKNNSDYVDSNKISPDELASYTVKLALSALPMTDSTGQWVQHEQEKLKGLPIGTNYKESLDYLQKKLANTFSYEAQNKLFNEALLKRPNLRFLNNWFRFNEKVTTKDDLLLRTAFFNTFAKADVPFIIAVLGKEFRSFTPKTSREEDFLKKWESNMINSPVVSFDTAKNTYVLNVKKLKQQTETESQGATGKKITTNYYEFLKLLGYPENIKALTSSSAMEDVRFIKSQLTENIPIHEFFDKEGLKINKELLAITNAAIEASDVQESISIKDSNNNNRNSIGIPTALHLLLDQYKRGGLEYSLINNIPNNKMLKEIQAGNVEIINLAQYKNDNNIKSDFDSLDESGMAEAYVNFLLDDMYPYLPSGDRGSEYAFRVKWSHDNLPTIKNLMGVIKDINSSVAERDKLIKKEKEKTGKDAVLTQYGLPLFFGITTESQLTAKIAEEAASIKQNFERLGLKTKGIDFNEVALRYWYSFTQQGQLFTGDVTNFKDPFKRFTLFTSTRTAMINDQAFNDSLNKLYPRLDGKKADGFEKTVVFIDPTSDFPEMEKQFNISAKDYKEQKEIFDAAGAVTLDAYREIMIKSDKWNEDWDTWYDYMANKSDKRPRVAGPILKTIYSGPLFDENNEAPENVYIPAAYKSAYKVLTPRTNNAEEQKMYDKMVAKQIGIALFKSGSKLQNLALQDMNAEEFTETQNISYDYMGFNLDTSGEEHLHVTFGTQSGKLLTVDLFGKGAPTTLNTRNGVKSKDEVINSYNTHIQELDALRRKTFLENLGLEITPDNKLQVRDGNYDRLVARIEQGLLARNTTSVTEYQVKEILRSREKLVDALAEKTKFENMIMSIYNSDVVKRNMPGKMLVQVPDLTGELKFYTKNEKGYTNLSEIRITLPKKLVPYVKTLEGKNFSEKLALFNTMIAEGKVDKRILTLVPFRIPSQLQNAIEAVEIKAFLDPALGNTMEVPAGITVKVGSDFDVDKLTTYMPNFAITKDGLEYVTEPKDSSKLKAKVEQLKSKVNELKLEKARTLNSEEREAANISDEQYVEIIERLTDELDEIEPELQKLLDEVKYLSAFSPKKVLENKVISDFIDILTSQELQENFLTPDSTDVLMGIGTEINNVYQKEKIDKADNTAKLSFNNVIKTRTNLLRFKSLVGQAALAATSHSLAQKAGLTYDNPELRGIYFTNAPKDDIIRLDLIVNPVDGIKPSDIFKQFISASVDVSKEGNDYLVNANVNERTFPVIQALIKAGVPLRDVMYFINQPILRELQEKIDRNNSIANLDKKSPSKVAADLLKSYGLNRYYYTLDKTDDLTKFSTSELKGMLTTTPIENLTELQKKKQTEILYQYEMYKNTIAKDMSELQQVTAVDTKQGGKSLAENLIRKINADNLTKKGVFGNLDKMFSKTILKEQKLSADMAYDLWPNVFKFALHSTENGKELLEKFFDDFSNALTTNKINALETLDRFLTAYILLTNEVKGKASIGSFYTRLIEKGEAVKELIKMKDKYPDNPVIKQLVPMMPDNERDTYNIKLFSRNYSAYEKETLIQGFEELMVDEPEFAKKLIMQQLLQSGVSASMVSYQDILPKEYINVTKDRLANFAFTPEQVLKDFYETMWKNPNILESKFIASYKGGKLYRKTNAKYLSIVSGEKVNGKNKKYLLKNTGEIDMEGNNIFTPMTLKSNYPYGINIGSINMNRGSDLYIPQASVRSIEPTINLSREWAGDLNKRPVYTPEGVNTMRTSAAKENENFGNPWSEGGFSGTIKTTTIPEAVQNYKDWLLGNKFQNVKPAQKTWILSQIAQGKLDGATLLYAGKLAARGQGMHPTALAEVVKQIRTTQSKSSTTTTEESDSPFIEGESEIMSTFTKVDKAIEDAWNSLTMDQMKDLEKRKGIKSLQDFQSAITDMITGGMTQEEALKDIKEC